MLNNMKLATKLFGSFLIVLALMAGLGLFALNRLAIVNDSAVDLATNWMPSVRDVLITKSNLNRVRVLQMRVMLETEPAALAVIDKEMVERMAMIRADWDDYAKLLSTPEERQGHQVFKTEFEAFAGEHAKLLDLVRQNKPEEARREIGRAHV